MPHPTEQPHEQPTGATLRLGQAQHLAWLYQQPTPATSREALARLRETARLSLEALDGGQLVASQSLLEETLVQVLVAMKTLNLNPDAALQRGLDRLQTGGEQRAFHIFADRVEIRVRGEHRGEWSLDTQADYEAALTLARELGCDVLHEDACQLGLFQGPSNPDRAHAEHAS